MKSTAGIATLLAEGIGDTIRYSLTADPVEEARAGRQLLEALGLRERKNVDLIACPSCGRAEIDVIEVAEQAQAAFGERELPLQVAVMGCVVNGPGEARDADIGIAAGNKRGHLFVKGRNVAVVPEDEMVDALVDWAEFINEHGVEARPGPGRHREGGTRGRQGPGARSSTTRATTSTPASRRSSSSTAASGRNRVRADGSHHGAHDRRPRSHARGRPEVRAHRRSDRDDPGAVDRAPAGAPAALAHRGGCVPARP